MSLRLKTILGVAAIEAVLLVFLVSTVLRYMQNTNEEGLIQRAETVASLFATTSKDAVLSYDLASLETFSSEVMKNPGMVYARVIGPDDALFAEAGDKQQLSKRFKADSTLQKVTGSVFNSYADIEESGIVYGRVEVGISTQSIDVAIAEAQQLSAIIAVIEMCLVALFSYFLGAYLTGQLKSLRHAARSISKGELNVEVPIKGKDEIAEVASAFNRMVVNLKAFRSKRDEHEKALQELNQSLEDRVARRTATLEEKHRELSCAYEKIKKAQAQLLQSEKMASVGQLAAGVAHEINNPVGFVSSNLESLQGYITLYQTLLEQYAAYLNSNDEGERARIAGEIRQLSEEEDVDFVHEDITALLSDSIEGATRVRDIVQGLKDFSHVDNSERQLTDINKCIESTLKMANNELKYRCEVKTDLQSLPDIPCNPGQLNQVLLNLVVNASHAIEDKGVIDITTQHCGEHVEIRIKDNGKGISQENIDKLFDPFFTTKPVGQGTGLGLAIVYGIIQDHAGDILVESEVGVGTQFLIRLPVVAAEAIVQAA